MKRFFLILSFILNLNFSQALNANGKSFCSKSFVKRGQGLKEFYKNHKLQIKMGSLVFGSSLLSLYILQTDPEQLKKEVLLTCQSFLSFLLVTAMLVSAAQADIDELS